MINTWFISDTHFFHKNILEYESAARPFKTLDEMHEVMIERWNNVVRQNDIVYHLGDFSFGKHGLAIADLLNGKKRLIMGNHDTCKTSDYLNYFEKLYGIIFWNRCILSHVPVHANGLGSRWLLNVHGHLHSRIVMSDEIEWKIDEEVFPGQEIMKKIPDISYFNVSCEQNNLTPIHADIIRDRLKEIE
jgi:calcineurin-like phosphoesterase family protein